MPLVRSLQSLRNSRSFWAMFDQGVLSLGTFLTNAVLMRTYHADLEFSIYMLLVLTIAFVNSLHASLVTYPLSVKGAAMPDDKLRGLTMSSLLLTFIYAGPLLLIMLGATWYLDHLHLFPFVAAATLAWQLQETTRRALMAHLRNAETVLGDVVSYLGQAAVVIVLCLRRVPTLQEVFVAMTITSLLGAAVQAWQLRLPITQTPATQGLVGQGWHIGRWLLMTNGLNFLTIQAVGWTIYTFHVEQSAAFFALGTIMGVSHPVLLGISGLIVPGVAKAKHESGEPAARRFAWRLGAIGGLFLTPYFALLLIAPAFVIHLFAGAHSPFEAYTTELRWYVVQYMVLYLSIVLTALLNGLEAARWTFYGQVGNAALNLGLRLPLTAVGTMATAIWSGIFTYGAQALIAWIGLRARRDSRPDETIVAKSPLAVEAG